MAPWIRFAPGVPDVEALGAADPEALLAPEGRLGGWERATQLRACEGGALWRYPLPGTPGSDGRLTERPRGAGTGWLWLWLWQGGGLSARWRARVGAPRSASLAERQWNLSCHLREHGLGTPELMAVGSAGRGLFEGRSFLVCRELEHARTLDAWPEAVSEEERGRGWEALGTALKRLFDCGVQPRRLASDEVYLAVPKACESSSAGDEALFGGLSVKRGTAVRFALAPHAGLGPPLAASERAALVEALLEAAPGVAEGRGRILEGALA